MSGLRVNQDLANDVATRARLRSGAGFKDRRKRAQFIVAGLYRIPFSEHNAAHGAKHQVHEFAFILGPKGKGRWHFACRAYENCCTVSSLHP